MSLNDRAGVLRGSLNRGSNSKESSSRARKANLLADLGSHKPEDRSDSKKGHPVAGKVPLEDKLKSYLRNRESKADSSPIDRRTVVRNLTDGSKYSPILSKINSSPDSTPFGNVHNHRKNQIPTDKTALSKDKEGRINSARGSSNGISEAKHKRTNTMGQDMGKLNRNTNTGSSSSRNRQVTQINTERGRLYQSPLKNRQSNTHLVGGISTDRSARDPVGLLSQASKYTGPNRKSPINSRPATGSIVGL